MSHQDQSGGGLVMTREYRKGNWTMNETMILIEAKKMDDERRMRRSIGLPPPPEQTPQDSRNKPAELRWKWIEDYCWRKGCMRSQNQCNDKWDNLMRDYKKVREYERRRVESSFPSESASSSAAETASYWKMEKSERKERNLPSNMLPQTYQALFEVVESKTQPSSSTAATALTAEVAAAIGSGNGSGGSGQIRNVVQQQGLGFITKHHHIVQPPPVMLPVSTPPPQPLQPLPRPLLLPPPQPLSFYTQPILPTKDNSRSDSDTSHEYSDTSPAKRRRTTTLPTTTTAGPSGFGGGGGGDAEETEEAETTAAVAAALSRSAFVIANAIKESEERQDRRHKEVMSLQERRLKIEETNVETNREGMIGMVEAINKLASSIFSLASSSSSTTTSRHNNNNNNNNQGGPS